MWGQEYWFRAWFDGLEVFWREFAAAGPMPERSYTTGYRGRAPVSGAIDTGTLAATVDVPPGAAARVRFVVSWSYPNFAKYWQSRSASEPRARPPTWRNHYATRFADSVAGARYPLAHWQRLHSETVRFKEALYAAVKKSIEFAWADSNEDRWDADRDGVLEGRQHHTLDMELFGPNSWLTGFYLGALTAGAEMAEHLGERGTAAEYRGLFERGRQWVDRHLFNGAWYHQQIDVRDRFILERFLPSDPDIIDTYWNDEAGEIKYQIADGSEIDQLNAQWHANLCGLGDLFDPGQRRTALRSL